MSRRCPLTGRQPGLGKSVSQPSKIVRDQQRRVIVARQAGRRAQLRAVIASPSSSADECEAAVRELRRQPRNAGATRVRNRDVVDGRPRGHLRAFGVSRSRLRELARAGHLPGVRKSGW